MLMDQYAPTVKHLSLAADGNALRVGPGTAAGVSERPDNQLLRAGQNHRRCRGCLCQAGSVGVRRSHLFWQNFAQMDRLKPFRPESRGMPRLDDKRMLNGIIFINCNGLRWFDACEERGSSKKLYTRCKR